MACSGALVQLLRLLRPGRRSAMRGAAMGCAAWLRSERHLDGVRGLSCAYAARMVLFCPVRGKTRAKMGRIRSGERSTKRVCIHLHLQRERVPQPAYYTSGGTLQAESSLLSSSELSESFLFWNLKKSYAAISSTYEKSRPSSASMRSIIERWAPSRREK